MLEGLANETSVLTETERNEIIALCQDIRGAIDMEAFINRNPSGDAQSIRFTLNHSSNDGIWNRSAAEGMVILGSMLQQGLVDITDFQDLASSLELISINWQTASNDLIPIHQASFHGALFAHGLRSMHGFPITTEEYLGLTYFKIWGFIFYLE